MALGRDLHLLGWDNKWTSAKGGLDGIEQWRQKVQNESPTICQAPSPTGEGVGLRERSWLGPNNICE
jgi:hypothetical protein